MEMKFGYARVSTQEQNLDLQKDELLAAGCVEIFTEKASGAQRDRPELMKLLSKARKGDTIVVWKLDRLARSMKQLIETVQALDECGINFRSLTEKIDTSTAEGELVFHLFCALAQFERSLITQRTKAGLASARARGRLGGRPKVITQEDLQKAKALLGNPNITVNDAAKTIGTSPATLYRYMKGGRNEFIQENE